MPDSFNVVHDLYKLANAPIQVAVYDEFELTSDILQKFLESATDGHIGVAPAYGQHSALAVLAFSTAESALVITLGRYPPNACKGKGKGNGKKNSTNTSTRAPSARQLLHEDLFTAKKYTKFAFFMDTLCTALYYDLDMRIAGAVDLLSMAKESRHSPAALMSVLGGERGPDRSKLVRLFRHEESSRAPHWYVPLQAWAAWRAGTLPAMQQRVAAVPRINTRQFSEAELRALARATRVARRLADLKPMRVENEVESEFRSKGNRLQVTSTRYKTRVLASSNQRVQVQSTVAGKTSTFSGKAKHVDGRSAHIVFPEDFQGDVLRVTTIGREGPTRAETARAEVVLSTLQQTNSLLDHPFFEAIWIPDVPPSWSKIPHPSKHDVALCYPYAKLNGSQQDAVRAILSNRYKERVVMVQGPPGSGKTTVIAAAVVSILSAEEDTQRTVWVVAQSNVAVKNIAEKLAKAHCEFTLLVAKDFHYDWHEHLYEKIKDSVFRSDDLVDDVVSIERRLMWSRVVLCTIGMLSNPRASVVTRLIPVQTVIVDEASQVETGDYLPMLSRFSHSLRKMVFIGDDKQLPPHGAPKIEGLKSVFEMEHLRSKAIFLDTQMPEQLGSFLGKHVYDGKLKTVHAIADPCCRFIEAEGKEVSRGSSWINAAEVKAVMAEAHALHDKGRSYRIITPYDAQRAMLEASLKSAKIPWENKVFCVDAFQGNEDDYIIVSTVRTEKIGFISDVRRVNVMLSRCKKGMIICANRAFVEGAAKDTLVGLLARELGENAWS